MPEVIMIRILVQCNSSVVGLKNKIKGNITRPMQAVKTMSTAVSLFLKYFSTRYLSIWVDIAQSTGPENAKISHMLLYYHILAGRLGEYSGSRYFLVIF